MSNPTELPRLRVISWNLHTPPFAPRIDERIRAIADAILALGHGPGAPDFLLLQELWFPSVAADLSNHLAPAYEVLRLPEGFPPGDRGGLLSLVRPRSEWRVQSTRFEPFTQSAPAWRIWEGDGFAGKGMERIECRSAGGDLALINTHLQAQYAERSYSEIRNAQLVEVRSFAESVDPSVAVLVCGDLNTRPDESIFVDEAPHWIDLSESYRRQCACGTHIADSGAEQWLDYVLARSSSSWRVEVERIERIVSQAPDIPYSDHHGIDATIRFGRRSEATLPLAIAAMHELSSDSTRREWLAHAATLAICGVSPYAGIGLAELAPTPKRRRGRVPDPR